MSGIAFGRRVIPLSSAPEPRLTSTLPPLHVHSDVPQAVSNISKQMARRRLEKLEEMRAAQAERDRCEVEILRVLKTSALQRLNETRRRRDELRSENTDLVRDIQAHEARVMDRVAEVLDRNLRRAAAATSVRERAQASLETRQAQAQQELAIAWAGVQAEMTELARIQEELAAAREEKEALEHEDEDQSKSMARRAAMLRHQIASVQQSQEDAEDTLRSQVRRARDSIMSREASRVQEWTDQLADAVLEAFPSSLKNVVIETSHCRLELARHEEANKELAEAVEELEKECRALRKQLQTPPPPLLARGLPAHAAPSPRAQAMLEQLAVKCLGTPL
eukprot:m.138671 g.138671  ORF g.138671 m.138671 type:complete len:336 (+) comp14925_c1_seq1:71-1078(+)